MSAGTSISNKQSSISLSNPDRKDRNAKVRRNLNRIAVIIGGPPQWTYNIDVRADPQNGRRNRSLAATTDKLDTRLIQFSLPGLKKVPTVWTHSSPGRTGPFCELRRKGRKLLIVICGRVKSPKVAVLFEWYGRGYNLTDDHDYAFPDDRAFR